MPHRPRPSTGQFVFHVFNRAIQAMVLFQDVQDYDAFLALLTEASERSAIRILAYAVMPNHWHMVVWPTGDGQLSSFMHWLTLTHARRWRDARGTTGRGAVYQGRFRAVPIQQDHHYLVACRYVERNPLRARLAARAEDWPWSSASPKASQDDRPRVSEWPVRKPADWLEALNTPDPPSTLEEIRKALKHGLPFGDEAWQAMAAAQLRWPMTWRKAGRPRGSANASCSQVVIAGM